MAWTTPKIALSPWGSTPHLIHGSLNPPNQNGILIGSVVFAQRTVECQITLQWVATFSSKIAPSAWYIESPIKHMVPRAHRSHKPQKHLDWFSRFRMGLKCCAVQCTVNGEENHQNFPLGILSPHQRTDLWPYANHTKIWYGSHMWFGRYARGQTDPHTYTQTCDHYNTSPPLPRVK